MSESALTSRRDVLLGGVAALATLMLAGGATAAASRAASRKDDPRFAFAQCLADLVIPRTDTPGAADVNTGGFVLMAVDERMGSLEPGQIDRLREVLNSAAGGDFLQTPRERQEALLATIDARAFDTHAEDGKLGADWLSLKSAILAGYYTSEVGASKELRFEPVPGTRENITIGPDFRMFSNQGFGGSL